MKTVEVHDPQHFDETIKKVLAEGSHLLVLFEGEEDSTGQSWCSDCRKAKPILDAQFAKLSDKHVLVVAKVKRSDYKDNDNYFYRKHAVGLKAVPTLVHWKNTGPKEKLIEEYCYDEELVEEFFHRVGVHD